MESPVSNSFIPHDATDAPARRSLQGGGAQDLFTLLAIVLFVASAALAVGVFLYNQYLNAESTSKANQIQEAKANFNTALIDQIETLSQRITSSEQILGQHLAPTAFFAALDASTLQTVSFSSLDLEVPATGNITIKMNGVARSVNSIAEQAQLFSQNGVITNPIFSGIDREADGVHFQLTADINASAINYGQLLQAAQQGSTPSGVNPLPQINATTSAPGTGSATSSPFGAPASSTQK